MKHLSAFFRPTTNALSAWSVGLHSFFSHLLISAGSLPQRNVSVTSASAAIVGTPSRRRRGLMLKPLAFMLLFLLGSLNVWGASHTWSYSFAQSDLSTSSGDKTFTGKIDGSTNKDVTWACSAATYIGWESNKGIQIGSGKNPQKDNAWTMTTAMSNIGSSIKITSIKINVAVASSGGGKYILSAGSATSGASGTSFNNTSSGDKTYNVTTDITSGDIVISLQSTTSKAMYIKSVTIGYDDVSSGGGGGSQEPAVLQSIAVSGTPTKKSYEAGEAFNPAGLVVTGTYDKGDPQTISEGITWTACKTEDGEYVALDENAVALVANETSIYVKATTGVKTSQAFLVTDLTVTAPLPTITITQSQVTSFTNTYAEYSWTADGVSGKMYAYKNSGMQFNSDKTGYYVYNIDPIPGVIRKITMTKASGTDRNWTPYVSTTALTSTTGGTSLTAKSVGTAGTSWDVTGSNSYFYLTVSGGSTVISSIVITYEEVKNAVTVASPATGTGTLSVTGAADLSEVLLGKELTVTATPTAATHHGGTVKVIKTGVTPEVDVTSTVYNAGTGKLTMPDYPITVSATFVADAAISVAVATGQSSWGGVKLYNSTPAEVSSGTTFKPNAGFKIEATPASDDYEFVSWAKSDGSDITLSVADAAKSNPTLTAGEVSTTFTATFREAAKPYLTVDPELLSFGPIAVNGSQNKTFKLTGQNLTEDASLAISGTGAVMFSVAASVAKDGDGAIDEDVTVTYNPTAAGTHTATLTISSTGATPVEVTLSGEAKVQRAVKWYSSNSTEITGDDLGEATTSVLDGGKVTTLPDDPESCDESISFQGWTNATYAKSDDAPTVLFNDAEHAPAVSGGNASYYAVWANGGLKSDVLTRETTGVTNGATNYSSWNNKTVTSTAVYAGQSAGGNDAIQLRSNNNNSGVVTTASGGKATKVSVVWQSDTQTDRTLNVYGKNSAYSAASDLYGEATQGTLLGTIVKGSSTELTITGDYAYIGVHSASGAMYMTSLTVQWSKVSDYSTTCSAPVVIADPTFSLEGGTYNDDQELTISKTAPATTIYYTDDNSDPKNSATKKTYSSALTINQDVTIKAIATDGNGNWSEVVSKTYVINYSTSIAAFIEKAQASARALKLNAAQNCIITGIRKYVSSNTTKYDIYIQDASNKGIIVYGLTTLPEGAAEGKRIEGAISGTYALANGQYRITGANFTNATFNAAEALTPADITAVDADAYAAHPIMLVKLSGVYYNTGSYYFTSEAEGEGTSNYVYDSFKKFDGKTMPANTVACDITGILINYNGSTPELLPLSLTTSATAVLPAISPVGGADAENAVEVTYMSTISVPMVENEEVYISVNDAEPALLAEAASVQIEGDVKLVVTAKRDFYADNTATYYYKSSAYPKQIAVTSEHGDVTVKVGDNTVSTALPGSNVTFTVAEAAHFHIATVVVNYEGGSLNPVLSEGKYSFTMPDKDVTIDLTYTEDTRYTITYAAGGATSGSAPDGALAWQYAGEDVELLANAYVWDEDHNFTVWKVTYGETELDKAVGQSFEMPAANVTITAQWVEKQYCALTLKVNGEDYLVKNIEQTIEQTISDLAGYENPANQNGYEFVGWATSQELNDVTETIETIESYTPGADEANKTLYAVFKRVDEGAPKTDVLTAADLTATSTGYVEFTGVSKTSNAVYAGNSAKNDADAIQLRSKESNSGIVSTTTGGVLQSVKINVASGSNTIDVYGSNTAYSAASDLYATGNNANQGTKIGSTSSTNTINAVADYKYVGIRSNSGAIYLSSVEITWQPKTTYYTTAPSAVYAVSYVLGEGGAWAENEGCDGANVKAGQTFDICESVPVRDHYKFNGWTVGGNAVSGTITINGATAITANWIAKVESNITYKAGTGTGYDAVDENNEEGAEIVLPSAADKSFSKDGYDFVGWLYNGELYKAGATFEMPASAVTFVAQWKKENITKMALVTNASQLVDGSKVVLANQTASTVAGESAKESDTYLAKVAGTFNEDKSILTNLGDGIELTLVQVTGGWALEYNGKYLKPYSTNKVAWDAAQTVWTITISSNNAIIETPGNSGSALRYNNNSGTERFSAYSSKTSCEPIQLYASMTAITDNADISDLGYVEGDVIIVNENKTLTMDVASAPASITVKNGATVAVNAETETNNLTVEAGGTVDVDETLNVADLYIQSNQGGTISSSQIINVANLNLNGDAYFDISFDNDAVSAGWYAFAVPFQVDVQNGIYNAKNGAKLTNESDYAVMTYQGDVRANGEYGWIKVHKKGGKLVPGQLYIIAFGDTEYNKIRFKKDAGATLNTSDYVTINAYTSTSGDNADGGWNGIGNSTLHYAKVSMEGIARVQYLKHDDNAFDVLDNNISIEGYVVGSAFFVQASGDGIMTFNNNYTGGTLYAPARNEVADEFMLTISKEGKFQDRLFVSASETASNDYEIGHDLVKLGAISGAAKVAQIAVNGYDDINLCDAEFPLVNNQAIFPLVLTAPATGTYTIAVERYADADLYLTYQGTVIWNLTESPYDLSLMKGRTDEYGLLLNATGRGVSTGVEQQIEKNGVEKFIMNDQLYILHNGVLYNANGQKVK